MIPDSYMGFRCPNPKCRQTYLTGAGTGAVRIKCQACKHTIDFDGGGRKPRDVDLGIDPAPDNSFKVVRCAECKRRLCDYKSGEWFKVKCSLCRNYNTITNGTAASIGREGDQAKLHSK